MDWLRMLVWPEQIERRNRLDKAITLARQSPPVVTRGDLSVDLDDLIAQAPKATKLVIFHTAVLAYLSETARRQFEAKMLSHPAHWISIEAPSVFPNIAARLERPIDHGRFVVSENGKPIALAGPHGQSLHSL